MIDFFIVAYQANNISILGLTVLVILWTAIQKGYSYIRERNPLSNKIMKSSSMLKLFSDYTTISIIWLLFSFVPYLFFGVIWIVVYQYNHFSFGVDQILKYIYAFSICMLALLQHHASKRTKQIIIDFNILLLKRKSLSKILFSSVKLYFVIFFVILVFINNITIVKIFYAFLFILVLTTFLYFGAFKIYKQCDTITIVFKNATSNIVCGFDDQVREDGFVTVHLRNDEGQIISITAYNQSDIAYIAVHIDETIDSRYREYIKRRGFSN